MKYMGTRWKYDYPVICFSNLSHFPPRLIVS